MPAFPMVTALSARKKRSKISESRERGGAVVQTLDLTEETKKDYFTAFGCINYAHGLLDAILKS